MEQVKDYQDKTISIDLEDIMIEFGDELTSLAYSYVKNVEIAKDTVQNVFVSCFLHLDSFEGRSSLKTWLYRITINKCKDYLKSSFYRKVLLFGYSKQDFPALETVEDTIINNELSYQLKETIFKLSVKYREVIMMHYYQDLSTNEISSILQISVHTVRTRLSRARKNLTKLLGEEEITYEYREEEN
ncbi:sigma-70 family RNA polymerase sigma factor [Metabacillus fastidiosus]|uniref:sigma-70 family RNA polymerase sigma factor n=1 Tax=Metabacillus fastidiosus TaxID=1458 RepID=UPI002E1C1FAA|nr:sigma-70 family RNA polymerase sigma factor [Metabacillus fastidiosus]